MGFFKGHMVLFSYIKMLAHTPSHNDSLAPATGMDPKEDGLFFFSHLIQN